MHAEGWKQAQGPPSLRYRVRSDLLAAAGCPFGPSRLSHSVSIWPENFDLSLRLLKHALRPAAEAQRLSRTAAGFEKWAEERHAQRVEWYIKLFLAVHFAANWVPVH